MNNETKNKMAAILAAAQEKAAAQTKQNFTPVNEDVKNYDNLQDIEKAAQSGEVISLLNLSELVNDKQPAQRPELSNYTIEEILTGYEPAEDEDEPEPQPIAAPQPEESAALKIVDYSPKSFAIVTAVKPHESILNILRQHGCYNSNLRCGKGWIFSKKHLQAIKEKLNIK